MLGLVHRLHHLWTAAVLASAIAVVHAQSRDQVWTRLWIGTLIIGLAAAGVTRRNERAFRWLALAACIAALVLAGAFDTLLVEVVAIGVICVSGVLAVRADLVGRSGTGAD